MLIKIKAILFVFLMAIFSCFFINTAQADLGIIPIDLQGGSIVSGSSSTNVSMNYEKVVLTYGEPEKYDIKSDDGEVLYTDTVMKVHVSAIFKMVNNGNKAEKINVYFPADTGDFARNIGEESLFNFKVNGKKITNKNSENVSLLLYGVEQKISAYQWSETFYPQKETQIAIEYDSMVYKDDGYNIYYLAYIIGTGRGWQGAIKKGDIEFVFPEALNPYAITTKPPQMLENKLPIEVKGNTINLSFSNYEPDSDDIILFGVYDFEKVNEIERLKKEQPSFINTLKIAGLFRELSYDGHCVFCTGATSENARNYYTQALDKAALKDEVNLVLGSFAYGFTDGKEENYGVQMNNLLDMLSFKNCEKKDIECKEEIYMGRDNLGDTPFGGFFSNYGDQFADNAVIKVPNDDFLARYADKINVYDPSISVAVKNFLVEIPVIVKASLKPSIESESVKSFETIENNNELNYNDNKFYKLTNPSLIIGFGILIGVLILYAIVREIRKRK